MAKTVTVEIGPYSIKIPDTAALSVTTDRCLRGAEHVASTLWIVGLGRYQIFVTLDARSDLRGLKEFIDDQTRSNLSVDKLIVNGVPGVRHGGYGPARTWIDWWFKRGDVMICLCLQSLEFPVTEPTACELAEHRAIVSSLQLIGPGGS